jgi:hypothetical protein
MLSSLNVRVGGFCPYLSGLLQSERGARKYLLASCLHGKHSAPDCPKALHRFCGDAAAVSMLLLVVLLLLLLLLLLLCVSQKDDCLIVLCRCSAGGVSTFESAPAIFLSLFLALLVCMLISIAPAV